jgi:pyruvate formate-lyase activating enzyme-like uncharacterized protein
MKYIKKLLINKHLKIDELKDIQIDELKIRPNESSKLDQKNLFYFINFLKIYKQNNVTIGNEKEIISGVSQMFKRYAKNFPKSKLLIKIMIQDNPELKTLFKDIL